MAPDDMPPVANLPLGEPLEMRALATPSEWAAYYALRYAVLRAPLGMPPGSERDSDEETATHLSLIDPATGRIWAVGRLQATGPGEGRIRYMAVDPTARGQGLGARLLAGLEARAWAEGYETLWLEARETVVGFYTALGWQDEGPSGTIVGLPHRRCRKGRPGL